MSGDAGEVTTWVDLEGDAMIARKRVIRWSSCKVVRQQIVHDTSTEKR